MSTNLIPLKEAIVDKPWGYEAWIVSTLNPPTYIINTEQKNLTLSEFWEKLYPNKPFPLLVKIIKADADLSVQVHPDDDLAKSMGYPSGKTEAFYYLKGPSKLLLGSKTPTQSLINLIKQSKKLNIEEHFYVFEIQKGQIVYVPAGTIHAILKDSLILEVEQNINVTFRIYDYLRGRELHLEEASKAIKQVSPQELITSPPLKTPYFNINILSSSTELEITNLTVIVPTEEPAVIGGIEVGPLKAILILPPARTSIKTTNPLVVITAPT